MIREEVIWAGGLFEGEGCISRSLSRGNPQWRLQLAMSDRDSVDRFAAAFPGLGSVAYKGKQKEHYKPQWIWVCSKKRHLYAVLAAIYPWLGRRRKARAREAMAEVLIDRRPDQCLRGHLFDDANTYHYRGARHCKTCRSDRQRASRAG